MVFTVWQGEVGKGGGVEGEERRKRSLMRGSQNNYKGLRLTIAPAGCAPLSLAGRFIGQKELMTPVKKPSSILCGAGAVVDILPWLSIPLNSHLGPST